MTPCAPILILPEGSHALKIEKNIKKIKIKLKNIEMDAEGELHSHDWHWKSCVLWICFLIIFLFSVAAVTTATITAVAVCFVVLQLFDADVDLQGKPLYMYNLVSSTCDLCVTDLMMFALQRQCQLPSRSRSTDLSDSAGGLSASWSPVHVSEAESEEVGNSYNILQSIILIIHLYVVLRSHSNLVSS